MAIIQKETLVPTWPIPIRRTTTRVGFLSLLDAAPIIIAAELGFFSRHGLNVELNREIGWGTIEDKIVYGELEASHATCPMLFTNPLRKRARSGPCLTGIILSRGGNAIVLSSDLWRRGVRDSETLRNEIFHRRHFRKYLFATVHSRSTHSIIFRKWLNSASIDPYKDIQLVTLPPSQMYRNLEAGTIDGFCAGEPWPSLAIARNLGWSPATSIDIAPGHPEKALMVREAFAEHHQEEHLALIRALKESCHYCQQSENRDQIAQILLSKNRINCSVELIKECLDSKFDYGNGKQKTRYENYLRFSGKNINRPTPHDGAWALEGLGKIDKEPEDIRENPESVFREDIYNMALVKTAPEGTNREKRLHCYEI